MPQSNDRRWLALILLCATQFMVVLDVSIVNVALPSIQKSLHFSESSLQWVTSAYALTFGGFLMLGGRAADLLGRRRLFMIGLVIFSGASLVCGLSGSSGVLIGARAVQGLGAAIISPAALSILTNTFKEGAERNTALGIWGAIAGLGGAAGVLLGGVLTDTLSWEWIFFINVPIGAIVLGLAPVLLSESRVEVAKRRYDPAGAITVTGGLVLLVYALVRTNDHSWASPSTLALFAASAVLLALFVFIELRSEDPVLPLRIFSNWTLTGANVVGALLGASIFAMFFMLSLYMQQVLGYSALRTGVAYLPVAISIIIAAAVSQALVTRIGVRRVLAAGMILLVVGLLWFARVSVDGTYAVDLLPGFLLAGLGLGFAFVPDTIAALQGVKPDQAGVASGLINTSQQIGGALGVAVLVTVASTKTLSVMTAHHGLPSALPGALTDGFHQAFLVGAVLAAFGLLATLLLIKEARPDEALATAPEIATAAE
jgi:EmrB/QacA subfamily drug resistance transporter